MDLYHIALFLHILAMLAATAATAITKLAVGRRIRARTLGEALEWHRTATSTARAFPIALVTFVATGAYMLSHVTSDAWRSGFVVAGLIGSALLLASGVYLSIQGKALDTVLAELLAKHGADHPVPRMMPRLPVVVLPVINTMIALGVAFDMVTKPSLVPALAILGGAIALGYFGALPRRSTLPGRAAVNAPPSTTA
jgi:hypothetical protein